jgi:hypothetical protein
VTGRVRAWVDARADGVPSSLLARMREAADEVDAADDGGRAGGTAEDGLHMMLAAAAVTCLHAAAAHADERGAALHLLAADALITDACEAAGHAGALDALAALYASDRLAGLIRGAGGASGGGGVV